MQTVLKNKVISETSSTSIEHHKICKKLLRIFEKKDYEIFMENMKVKIPSEKIYYYPDFLLTNEELNDENSYIKFQPILLADVIAEFNSVTVDKLIQYQKFPSLKYYLIVEQDKEEVIVVSRNASGNWQSETYNQADAIINLPALDMQISLQDVYAK